MKHYCLIFILLLGIFSSNIYAQNKGRVYTDSLLRELSASRQDTLRVYLYQSLAEEYNYLNMDSALLYGYKLLKLTDAMKWEEYLVSANINIGFTYHLMTKFDSALFFLEKALPVCKKNKDSATLAQTYTYISRVYANDNQTSIGLEYAFKALSIIEYIGSDESLLGLYQEIGDMYRSAEEMEKSMEYYQKALALIDEDGESYETPYLLLSLGEQYFVLEQLDSALFYSKKAKDLFEEMNNEFHSAMAIDIIAEIYLSQNKFDEALSYFKQSGAFYLNTNDIEAVAINLYNIGKVHLYVADDTTGYENDKGAFATTRKENYRIAIKKLEQSRHIYSKELNRRLSLLDVNQLLSQAYEGVGDMGRALMYYKEFMAIYDSVLTQNEGIKVAKLDAKRKMSAKNKELELQKLLIAKKRNERGFLIAGILLLLGGLLIVYKSYRARGKSNKLLEIEKSKSEELLLNILPEEVAEELKEKGTADAMHFDEVTVLFTDFVNFTIAGERMSSQELVDELHTCFKAFDNITSKYEIEKIKTIGDAYLAVCGLPSKDKNHAVKMVKAATEIRDYMINRFKEVGDKTFKVRIGVHSGDVVAGIVGVKKFAYDIWGDTVNTAARMEQNSETGKINISNTTYELIKDQFCCTYRGELDVKNKGKLKMYYVDRVRDML